MKRLFIVTGVALIALTGSAFAQDKQEPSWGGFYVGGHGGYGWGNRDGCFDTVLGSAPTSCSAEDSVFDYDQDGWLVGGQVGYNHMIDPSKKMGSRSINILLGLEADAAFASITGDHDFDGFPGEGEWTWLAGFKGRVGFAIDKVLLFATGGLALAGFDFEGSSGCEFTQTRDGYLVGGGVELKISERASLKVEYNHMDFGSEDQPCMSSFLIFDLHTITEADADVDVVKFGFNYRF